MKSMKKILALVLVLTMALTLMVGCGGKTEPAAPAATESEDGVVEIYFPTYMVGEATLAEWCALRIGEFNEQYAGKYKVVVEEIPGDQDYVDKLKVLYAADDLPDVIVTGGYNVIDMFRDKLVDLTPYVDDEWRSFMSDVGVKVNSRDGQLYAIPVIRQVMGYYYNTELFAQAGIEKPAETWEEFFEICDKLLAAGITPLSMDTADSGWCSSLLLGAIIGTSDAGEEFMNVVQPDNYSTPELIEAAAMVQTMFQKYTTADAIGAEYAVAANNFWNEKTAIVANGPWMVKKFYSTDYCEEGFGDKIAVAMYPEGLMYNSAQTGWSIAAKTPEKIEASLEFVKFMTNEESQRLILEMGGETPDCNVANADTFDLVVETINLAADCERSINDFQTLWHASVVDEISVQYPLLASGEITPEEFADALTAAAHR